MSLREAHVELIDCDHRTPPPATAGYPYVTIPNLRDGRIDVSEARRITPDHYREWTRRAMPRPNDVILSRRTNPGVTAFVPRDLEFALGQNLVLLRSAGSAVHPEFLRWLVRSPDWWEQIQRHLNVGAVFDSLKCADIPNFRLPIPPLKEQQRIAGVLTGLDDKIELNRRMSQTLESIEREIFNSWFVDFDPVRAKATGRDPGLPQPIADLFPASLEASEVGDVPSGWEIRPLGESVTLTKGRSYTSNELTESDTALVTLKSFARGGGYRPDGLKPFSGSYKPSQVVTPGELVIACTDVTQAAEVIGRPAIVPGTGGYTTLVASLDTMIVRPGDSSLTRAFLYFLGRTEAFVAHTYAHTTGTTVLHLAAGAIPSFRFACPPVSLVHTFDSVASPALDRMQSLEEESSLVAALRDSLLPWFMSGEVSVTAADEVLT